MEKRILLAVSLSFIVLVLYQGFIVPPPDPQDFAEPSRTRQGETSTPAAEPSSSLVVRRTEPLATSRDATEPGLRGTTAPTTDASTVEPSVAESKERSINIDTPELTATFSNRGAVVKSWRLKHYNDAIGEPLELVPSDLPGLVIRPFSLSVEDATITTELQDALYRVTKRGLNGDSTPGSLLFEYDNGAGLRVRKELRFDPAAQPYVVSFSASVTVDGRALIPTIHWGPGLTDTSSSSRWVQGAQGITMQDGSPSRISPSDVADTQVPEGNFLFVGIDDHYFLSVIMPTDPVRIEYSSVTRPVEAPDDTPKQFVSYSVVPQSPPSDLRFFIGPKDFDTLAAVDGELVRVIDFGFFAFLAVPLLRSLKWIYEFVGNYGWSIIILTILINAVMFPLRHKSVVSMRKMQEIQPEVKAIQARYANLKTSDPAKQKMNAELMTLYRERGVNPAGGCLPMLLTMPVLFAFYSLLSVAIEIRGAPFIFWITDLSVHDPLYITPVVMGITMVWQQLKIPSTADPMQQKVMMFMPVMFTFMFLWASSGLVLYWLTSNLWAIGQQIVTNRIIGPPVIKVVRPPAERRIKKAGRSKSKAANRVGKI